MKKVLVIAPYSFLPYYSGGQKYIARFLHYLGGKVDLTVISVAENDSTLAGNYSIIPLLKKSFSRYYDFSLIKKITVAIRKNRYDTVIWEHPYLAWLAFRIKKKTGVKTIIHTHNIEYQRFRSIGKWWWPVLKWYERWGLRKADAVFFITGTDKNFAINRWGLKKETCFEVPFGVEIEKEPVDRTASQELLREKHNIPGNNKIILFNGLLKYKPNLDALKVILEKINPILIQKDDFVYKIIICGKGLPTDLNELSDYRENNIIYAGFVDNIDIYFKGADVFLNPVQSGGGIKTKMVEAIAFGTTVISTASGAEGIEAGVCGEKLVVTKDNDWGQLAGTIQSLSQQAKQTPAEFYDYYSWKNIISNITG